MPASYPPTDGVADTNVSPTGRMSWTRTLVAVSVPRLSTVSVYSIVSPIDGSLLFTVLKISRSACFGVTEDVPVLLSRSGSGVVLVAVAVFSCCETGPEEGASTLATSVSVGVAPEATVPSVQTPLAKLPVLGVALTNCRPAGSVSVRLTFNALLGPRFSSVIVNVTSSSTFGVELSTVFETMRSASCGSVGVFAVLLRLFGSQTSLWVIVTVLNATLVFTASTASVRTSVWPGAIEGTLQTPPVGVSWNRVPVAGVAEMNATLAGSASVTSTFVATAVPRLKRLTV